MSEKKWQTVANVFGVVGLAAALPIVIHSLVTGEGIHTGGLLLMIYFVLHLLQQWKGHTWRALPVIAFGGGGGGFRPPDPEHDHGAGRGRDRARGGHHLCASGAGLCILDPEWLQGVVDSSLGDELVPGVVVSSPE